MAKLSMNGIKNTIERYLDLLVTDIEFDIHSGDLIIKATLKEPKVYKITEENNEKNERYIKES